MHHTEFDIGDEVILTRNGRRLRTIIVGVNLRKKLLQFHNKIEESVSYETEMFLGERFPSEQLELFKSFV